MQELKQIRASFALLNKKSEKEHEQFEKASASLVEANQVRSTFHFTVCIVIVCSQTLLSKQWVP